ncbi:MAG: hypothetical protein M3N53_06890 [Actinomycetota bacterium]|nr:hypothetical protein [Actinomycetota bacterium]
MSILIVAGGSELDEAIVRRLIEQGDDPRILEQSSGRRDLWRSLGAHVAVGDPADADLLERAAQNVRTIVVAGPEVDQLVLEAVVASAPRAGADRIVVCVPAIGEAVTRLLHESTLSYVLIATGRRGVLRRSTAAPELVAEAVDAADDLDGHPRLEVNLRDGSGMEDLGLVARDD